MQRAVTYTNTDRNIQRIGCDYLERAVADPASHHIYHLSGMTDLNRTSLGKTVQYLA